MNKILNDYRYECAPNPYETIIISPKNIDYTLRRDKNGSMIIPGVIKGGLGQIRGGNWDSSEYRTDINDCLQDGNMYFLQRFNQGKQLHETARYKYLVEKYTYQEVNKLGFNSVEAFVEDYLESYDKLFRKIKKEGYKSNHDGDSQNPDGSQPVKNKLETLVTIDRCGNINHWDGQHRKGIARALDIEIPAQVVCRHRKWQELRDEIHKYGLTEDHDRKLRDHPDLQDVLC